MSYDKSILSESSYKIDLLDLLTSSIPNKSQKIIDLLNQKLNASQPLIDPATITPINIDDTKENVKLVLYGVNYQNEVYNNSDKSLTEYIDFVDALSSSVTPEDTVKLKEILVNEDLLINIIKKTKFVASDAAPLFAKIDSDTKKDIIPKGGSVGGKYMKIMRGGGFDVKVQMLDNILKEDQESIENRWYNASVIYYTMETMIIEPYDNPKSNSITDLTETKTKLSDYIGKFNLIVEFLPKLIGVIPNFDKQLTVLQNSLPIIVEYLKNLNIISTNYANLIAYYKNKEQLHKILNEYNGKMSASQYDKEKEKKKRKSIDKELGKFKYISVSNDVVNMRPTNSRISNINVFATETIQQSIINNSSRIKPDNSWKYKYTFNGIEVKGTPLSSLPFVFNNDSLVLKTALPMCYYDGTSIKEISVVSLDTEKTGYFESNVICIVDNGDKFLLTKCFISIPNKKLCLAPKNSTDNKYYLGYYVDDTVHFFDGSTGGANEPFRNNYPEIDIKTNLSYTATGSDIKGIVDDVGVDSCNNIINIKISGVDVPPKDVFADFDQLTTIYNEYLKDYVFYKISIFKTNFMVLPQRDCDIYVPAKKISENAGKTVITYQGINLEIDTQDITTFKIPSEVNVLYGSKYISKNQQLTVTKNTGNPIFKIGNITIDVNDWFMTGEQYDKTFGIETNSEFDGFFIGSNNDSTSSNNNYTYYPGYYYQITDSTNTIQYASKFLNMTKYVINPSRYNTTFTILKKTDFIGKRVMYKGDAKKITDVTIKDELIDEVIFDDTKCNISEITINQTQIKEFYPTSNAGFNKIQTIKLIKKNSNEFTTRHLNIMTFGFKDDRGNFNTLNGNPIISSSTINEIEFNILQDQPDMTVTLPKNLVTNTLNISYLKNDGTNEVITVNNIFAVDDFNINTTKYYFTDGTKYYNVEKCFFYEEQWNNLNNITNPNGNGLINFSFLKSDDTDINYKPGYLLDTTFEFIDKTPGKKNINYVRDTKLIGINATINAVEGIVNKYACNYKDEIISINDVDVSTPDICFLTQAQYDLVFPGYTEEYIKKNLKFYFAEILETNTDYCRPSYKYIIAYSENSGPVKTNKGLVCENVAEIKFPYSIYVGIIFDNEFKLYSENKEDTKNINTVSISQKDFIMTNYRTKMSKNINYNWSQNFYLIEINEFTVGSDLDDLKKTYHIKESETLKLFGYKLECVSKITYTYIHTAGYSKEIDYSTNLDNYFLKLNQLPVTIYNINSKTLINVEVEINDYIDLPIRIDGTTKNIGTTLITINDEDIKLMYIKESIAPPNPPAGINLELNIELDDYEDFGGTIDINGQKFENKCLIKSLARVLNKSSSVLLESIQTVFNEKKENIFFNPAHAIHRNLTKETLDKEINNDDPIDCIDIFSFFNICDLTDGLIILNVDAA